MKNIIFNKKNNEMKNMITIDEHHVGLINLGLLITRIDQTLFASRM